MPDKEDQVQMSALSRLSATVWRAQGHSKNPTRHGRYSLGAIFAEVFAGDGYRVAETANDADGRIA